MIRDPDISAGSNLTASEDTSGLGRNCPCPQCGNLGLPLLRAQGQSEMSVQFIFPNSLPPVLIVPSSLTTSYCPLS